MSAQLTETDARTLADSETRHPRTTAVTPQQSRPAPIVPSGEPVQHPFVLNQDGVPVIGGLPYLP